MNEENNFAPQNNEPTPNLEPTPTPEPASESTSASEPAPVTDPTPAQPVQPVREFFPDQQTGQTPTAEAPKKKKSKTPVIIGASVAAAAIIGGSSFAVAGVVANLPENATFSALDNFFKADNISLSGSVEMKDTSSDGDSAVKSIKLTLSNAFNKDIETDSSATLEFELQDETVKVTLGTVMIKDGTIYLRLSDLEDTYKSLMNVAEQSADADMVQNVYYASFREMLDDLIGDIDGTWWRISLDEVLKETDMSASDREEMVKAYDCVRNVLSSEFAKSSEYSELYNKHKFVDLTEYSGDLSKKLDGKGKLYKVKINKKEFKAYAEAVGDREFVKELGKCYDFGTTSEDPYDDYDDYGDDDAYGKLDIAPTSDPDEDEDEFFGDDDFIDEIIISIDGFFSHHLTGLYMSGKSGSYTGEVILNFEYDKTEVSAPKDSKSASELVEKITTTVEKAATLYSQMQAAQSGGSYGYIYECGDDEECEIIPIDNCSPNGSGAATNCMNSNSSES